MTDIIKYLRNLADKSAAHSVGELWNGLDEAADEIERLRARIAELESERLAVTRIINPDAIEQPAIGDLELWAERAMEESAGFSRMVWQQSKRIAELEAQRVPDHIEPDTRSVYDMGYAGGWNDCREAMIEAAPQPDIGNTMTEPGGIFDGISDDAIAKGLARLREKLRGEPASIAPVDEPVISEKHVLAITTAYEQGVGKGHQSHKSGGEISNPYSKEWGCDLAWQMGYEEGKEQAEARAQLGAGPDFSDAYAGAREEVLIWKRRALEAEGQLRAESEPDTLMGEPVVSNTVPVSRGLLHQLFRVAGCKGSVPFDDVVRAAIAALTATGGRDDKERMDYLESMVVEVRTPLRFGTYHLFYSQTVSDEEEPYRTSLRKQIDDALAAAQPEQERCWCETCRPVSLTDMRMVLCPDCGNKRCPRATSHMNACTGSNKPGQPGSAYADQPAPGQGEDA